MALSSALNNALSGLNAAARASGVVSSNIANAMTEGYAQRSLGVTSNTVTGGVKVLGVQRNSDPGVIASRREADAAYGAANVIAGFQAGYETLVGTVGAEDSISARLADFETSLLTAASAPESAVRLNEVATQAVELAQSLSDASKGLQDIRMTADRSIGMQVDSLNQALQDIEKINAQIVSTQAKGGSVASLIDQRQLLVDQVNEIVPVHEVARDNQRIALYSDGGAILLDGSAATVSFSPTHTIVAEMTVEGGALSGLAINGVPVRTDSGKGPFAGGTLAAQFEVRDELAVAAQADLDAVARDLVERFETPGLDSTTPPGAPGLFTDSGAAFSAADEMGLAARLTVNAAVDPAQGGASWKLRDGLGATSPGDAGDARLLQAFGAVLSEARTQSSSAFGTGQMSSAQLSAALLSRAAQGSETADRTLSFASASQTQMLQIELEMGVDTDAEAEMLMLVEQAYAANARVIQAIDQMMEIVIGL